MCVAWGVPCCVVPARSSADRASLASHCAFCRTSSTGQQPRPPRPAVQWLEGHYWRQLYAEQQGASREAGWPAGSTGAAGAYVDRGPPSPAGEHGGRSKLALIIVPAGDGWDPVRVNKCVGRPLVSGLGKNGNGFSFLST